MGDEKQFSYFPEKEGQKSRTKVHQVKIVPLSSELVWICVFAGRKSRIGVKVGWDEMQIFAKALIGSGKVTREAGAECAARWKTSFSKLWLQF